MDVIYLLGTIAIYGLASVLLFTLIAGILLFVFLKWNRTLFPNLTLMIITAFSSPLKVLFRVLRLNQGIIDKALVSLMNKVFYIKFSRTACNERALFLPQCMRNSDCPAKLGADGIACISCQRDCAVKQAKAEAEKRGYRVFVVPGGGFIRRLVAKHRPKAVIGVACLPEVMMGLEMMSKVGLPAQGVVLLRSGCLNTKVDLGELNAVLAIGAEGGL